MERKRDPDTKLHEWFDMFIEGWRTGDAELILRSVADDFVYDDPVDGRLRKSKFAQYLKELFGGKTASPKGAAGDEFEIITEIVSEEHEGELTAWGWWKTASEEGAGLVKVGPTGVRLEKTAYYDRPAPS